MSTTESTRRADVPQLRLPRQVAAPDGPVDVTMMYVMHHAFRRDLVMFAEAAAATPATDRVTWSALAKRWAVFSEILHHHHSGEDAGLWPWLMRVATEDEQATLEEMEAEHEQIDPILRDCARGFERVTTSDDARAAAYLAERLAAARDTLLAHMGHEETDAMALVQTYMTQDDWDQVVEANFDKKVEPRLLLAAVPWIAYELPRPVVDRLLAEAGAPMKLVHLATRRRFERLQERATRYVA
ncbi:MAG: hemerythrin domain-containing protein [Nocardioidaceae bacterium]|nr:hemerythrin domain-containing protein [Nocardioidaceae bacterium]NUS51643.1 hemerythrin domain-containing protein [Nocardioidaceae bacterium]